MDSPYESASNVQAHPPNVEQESIASIKMIPKKYNGLMKGFTEMIEKEKFSKVCLISGPSNSGKSVLFNMLLGKKLLKRKMATQCLRHNFQLEYLLDFKDAIVPINHNDNLRKEMNFVVSNDTLFVEIGDDSQIDITQ